VQDVDERVVGVRTAVDPLATEFEALLAAVAPLSAELELVRAGVDRLELPLADMHTAVAPLGEAAARFGGLTGRLAGARRRAGTPPAQSAGAAPRAESPGASPPPQSSGGAPPAQ
jgi:hypothetical protein